MSENIQLGNNGKYGSIQQASIKGGVKLEQIKDKKLQAIFQSIDDGNGVLDEKEIEALMNGLNSDEDKGTITSKEVKKFLKAAKENGSLKDVKKEDVFKFLSEVSQASENIKSSQIGQDNNGNKFVLIEYNDGTTETVFPNNKKEITATENGVTITKVYQDNKLLKETKVENGTTTETEYSEDGETPTTQIIKSSADNSVKTIVYEGKNPKSAKVKRGIVTENYVYQDGKEILTDKVENEGIAAKEKRTTYTYNDDGTTTAVTTEVGRITTAKLNGETLLSSVAQEDNQTIETTVQDGVKTVRTTNKSDNTVVEVVTDGTKETTTHINADGKKVSQTVVKDGQIYEVKYDGKGNTYIVVQNGESPAGIARKFGTSANTLLRMNKHNKDELGNSYFNVGSTIRVPGELAADDKRLVNRRSAEEAKGDYVSSGAAAREAAVNRDADARKDVKWTERKYNTFEEIARELFRKEGITNPSNLELSRRIKDLKKTNPNLVDGQLKGKEIRAGVRQDRYDAIVERQRAREAREAERQNKITQKASAEQIVDDLKEAIDGINDLDKIQAAIARIDDPAELAEVNRLLSDMGYKADDIYSPIEKFIYEENNHSHMHTYNSSDYLESTVQKWIANGTLKGGNAINAQARMAARVIFDAGDGFGTDCEKTKKGIHMIKAPTGNSKADAQAVLRKVNSIVSRHSTFYGMGSASKDLTDYLEGELWDGEIKYLKGIMAEHDALAGQEKTDAVTGLVEEAVSGAGTDIEYLQQAIRAMNSPEDMKAVEKQLKAYCERKGIKPQIQGQSYLQAILYDECDTFLGISTDHKEIRKFNEMLIRQGAYTPEQAVKIRAEQAALQVLHGGFGDVQDALTQIKDPKVLQKMDSLIKTKGFQGLDDFLNKNFPNSTTRDLLKAELAANGLLSDDEASNIALRLLQNSDFNKQAKGLAAIRNGEQARAVDDGLKARGSSLEKVLTQFNKDKAEYRESAALWDRIAFVGGFIGLGNIAESISDNYRANTDASDNLYIEGRTAVSIPPETKKIYDATVNDFEIRLNKMKQDYQEALDGEGLISDGVNSFCSIYNIGTTRDEIEARIEHDTETLRLLKIASEGKLQKFVNGRPVNVSFEDVFNDRQAAKITANGAIQNVNGVNESVKFTAEKAQNIAQEANKIAAMDYAKDYISQSWDELNLALNSNDAQRLSVSIKNSLEKISQMSGRQLSLEGMGYTIKNGKIVDNNGNPVSVDKLKDVANQLKQGLSDISNGLFGVSLPMNSRNSDVSDLLEDGYENKLEQFKQEYRETMGQEVPDDMIDSYKTTISTGTMVVNVGTALAAVIAVPFTGGGSLAVFCAGAGATLVMQGLEQSTDANGWTNSEWTATATDALWNGALAAVGMKVGMLADGAVKGEYVIAAKVLAKNEQIIKSLVPNISPQRLKVVSAVVARAEATFGEVSSDVLQDLLQTYCMQGEFDPNQFTMNLIMSLGGNAAGHISGAIGDVKVVRHGDTGNGGHVKVGGEGDGTKVGGEGDGTKVDGEGDGTKVGGEGDGTKVGGEGDGTKVSGTKYLKGFAKRVKKLFDGLGSSTTAVVTPGKISAGGKKLKVKKPEKPVEVPVSQKAEIQNSNVAIENHGGDAIIVKTNNGEPKVVELKKGEKVVIGKDNDGLDLVAVKDADGDIKVHRTNDPSSVEVPHFEGLSAQDKQALTDAFDVFEQKYGATMFDSQKAKFENVKAKAEFLDDPVIAKYIKDEVLNLANGEVNTSFDELEQLLDAVNGFNGHYSTFKAGMYSGEYDYSGISGLNRLAKKVQLSSETPTKIGTYNGQDVLSSIYSDGSTVVRYMGDNGYVLVRVTGNSPVAIGDTGISVRNIGDNKVSVSGSNRGIDISQDNATIRQQLIDSGFSPSKADDIMADLADTDRTYQISRYIGKNENPEMANYLYEKYYLQHIEKQGKFAPAVIEKCRDIQAKYGCHIFLSATGQPQATLEAVDKEFSKWAAASGGQAKFPPMFNFDKVRRDWYDTHVGGTSSAAYSMPGYNGSLEFSRQEVEEIMHALRHEMTHTNDLAKVGIQIPNKYKGIIPAPSKTINGTTRADLDKVPEEWKAEMRKAGLSDSQISYAFYREPEFIAVASEGNLASYSPWFRQIMIDCGFPAWEFNLDAHVVDVNIPGGAGPRVHVAQASPYSATSPDVYNAQAAGFSDRIRSFFGRSKTPEQVLNSSKFDDQFRTLSVLKNPDGTQMFSEAELRQALSTPKRGDIKITSKDLYAIATSGMSKKDALYTISHIFDADGLAVVRKMTNADGIFLNGSDLVRSGSLYKFNAMDIQEVRMAVMNSNNPAETLQFVNELIDNRFNSPLSKQFAQLQAHITGGRQLKTDGDLLNWILKNVDTPEKRQNLMSALKASLHDGTPVIHTTSASRTAEIPEANIYDSGYHSNSPSAHPSDNVPTTDAVNPATVTPQPAKRTFSSVDEIYDEMDKIREQMKTMRTGGDYDKKLLDLQNELSQLDIAYNELRASFYGESPKLNENIHELNIQRTTEQSMLKRLQENAADAEQQAIYYRSALADLEKQLADFNRTNGSLGGQISELYEYAPEVNKRFIGAENADNLTKKAIPDNAPSYYYQREIADLFHSYNITAPQNKAIVVQQLREKLAEMENSLSRAQSRVASQQKLVEEIDANYTSAVDNYNKRGQEFEARTQEYKAKKAALLEDKTQIEQDKENYLANVKNSPEYLRLSDEWKSLQLQAREFGS